MTIHLIIIEDVTPGQLAKHCLYISSEPFESEQFDQEAICIFSSTDPVETSVQRTILDNILRTGGCGYISYD